MKNKTPLLIVPFVCLFVAAAPLSGQSHQLVKKWETEPTLKTPESALYDAAGKQLYVSNIDGRDAWAKDGKGSIARVGLDGKIIAVEWVTGLQAPKGLGLYHGKLYAADIDRVVVIDVAKAAIVQTIPVEGAQGLNDITIDAKGVVYVSDSKAKRIYTITDGKPALWLENLKGPNGVLSHGGDFYALDSGGVFKVGKDKTLARIADGLEPSTDGIEHVEGGDFIVSCWVGTVYYVSGKGEKQLLLDTRPQKLNTADIGYDAKSRTVYVPTFFGNTIAAYELK